MTRRDWWLAIGIALLVVGYLAFPRYEWRNAGGPSRAMLKIDHSTGRTAWVGPEEPARPRALDPAAIRAQGRAEGRRELVATRVVVFLLAGGLVVQRALLRRRRRRV